MKLMKHTLFPLLLLITMSPACGASSIAGVWRHSEKPAWLDFRFNGNIGQAFVVRHDDNAGATGLAVFKDIYADERLANHWHGKIYAANVDDFIDAMMTQPQEGLLVITIRQGADTEVLRLVRDGASPPEDTSSGKP